MPRCRGASGVPEGRPAPERCPRVTGRRPPSAGTAAAHPPPSCAAAGRPHRPDGLAAAGPRSWAGPGTWCVTAPRAPHPRWRSSVRGPPGGTWGTSYTSPATAARSPSGTRVRPRRGAAPPLGTCRWNPWTAAPAGRRRSRFHPAGCPRGGHAAPGAPPALASAAGARAAAGPRPASPTFIALRPQRPNLENACDHGTSPFVRPCASRCLL